MKKTAVLLLAALILGQALVVNVYALDKRPWDFRPKFNETPPERLQEFETMIENYTKGRIIVSSLNMILYGYLVYFYVTLYRENESKFSLGLSALAFVLLVYSISSNPLTFLALGRKIPFLWMALFTIIPDIFASVAAVIMVYLSRT